MAQDLLPDKLYTTKTMFTLGGSSAAVWMLTSVLELVFDVNIDKYKWIGLATALFISFAGTINIKNIGLKVLMISLFNGLMIYLNAVGIDSINQGISRSRMTNQQEVRATLIPFSDGKAWWPTAYLSDSVAFLKKNNLEIQSKVFALERTVFQLEDSIKILLSKKTTELVKKDKIAPITKPTSHNQGSEYYELILTDLTNNPSMLYLDCENTLKIEFKEKLKNSESVKLFAESKEGTIITKVSRNIFSIIPTISPINISVIRNKDTIRVAPIEVKKVTLKFVTRVDGRLYETSKGIPRNSTELKLIPVFTDKYFAINHPKDSALKLVGITLQKTNSSPITKNNGVIIFKDLNLGPGDEFSVFNVQILQSSWKGIDRPSLSKLEGQYKILN
jgi:hypothetical protein